MRRGLGLDVFPSVAAALLTVLAPVRMMRLGHLHLLHFACFPLALYFLHRYLEKRRWRDALAAGLLLNAQFLSGYYLAVMAGIGAFLYLLAYALRGPFSYLRGALPGLLAIGVATVLIQVPFLIPYFRVSREWQFTRSLAESEAHSGVPADLARRPNNQIPIPGFLSAGTRAIRNVWPTSGRGSPCWPVWPWPPPSAGAAGSRDRWSASPLSISRRWPSSPA